MQLIAKKDYNKVKPLFKNIKHSIPIVFSLLEGNSKGVIYVDNINKPQTAFIYLTDCFCYIVGNHLNTKFNEQLKDFIHNTYLPHLNNNELIIFTFNKAWDLQLSCVLSDLKSIKIKRVVYDFDVSLFSKSTIDCQLPSDFCVKKYNGDNIKNLKLPVLSSWLSTEKFLQNGLAVFISYKTEIIAYCYSVYAGNNNVEIDIFTKEQHRGKGYATYLAKYFINECLKKGLRPNWSCWPEKKSSMKIAVKLGFTNKQELPVHLWASDL
ncbi:GNAT family N-acetyltransferase [Clostridium sp. 'deep sea']|uniref:GNAT family N-acetyltransferase n=1 Tax=Clostridium sp. 'deep sea' TaxID=2779445 RepID=UPI0018965497|nr:GNAT family N-acetyltransferase [Clostridium sp. 'deep sea']QOR35950.1 GNAT family N-acetyltransferase [Clostridium sp. 'deep sea']